MGGDAKGRRYNGRGCKERGCIGAGLYWGEAVMGWGCNGEGM